MTAEAKGVLAPPAILCGSLPPHRTAGDGAIPVPVGYPAFPAPSPAPIPPGPRPANTKRKHSKVRIWPSRGGARQTAAPAPHLGTCWGHPSQPQAGDATSNLPEQSWLQHTIYPSQHEPRDAGCWPHGTGCPAWGVPVGTTPSPSFCPARVPTQRGSLCPGSGCPSHSPDSVSSYDRGARAMSTHHRAAYQCCRAIHSHLERREGGWLAPGCWWLCPLCPAV